MLEPQLLIFMQQNRWFVFDYDSPFQKFILEQALGKMEIFMPCPNFFLCRPPHYLYPLIFFFSSSVKDSVSSSNSTWINLIYFSVCLQNGSRSIARWIFSQTMHAFSNCGDQPRVKVLIAGSHSNPTPSLLLERELLIAWNKRSFSDPHGERQFQHICFGELIYDHRQF